MKLVRPGSPASQPLHLDAAAAQRLRVGRFAGALLAAGWLLTLALALVAGPPPDASGTSLALAGAAIGVVLARRRWDLQQERSLRVLVGVGALHAAAAMVALDPSATVSAPIFVAVAALVGILAPGRAAVLACPLPSGAARPWGGARLPAAARPRRADRRGPRPRPRRRRAASRT